MILIFERNMSQIANNVSRAAIVVAWFTIVPSHAVVGSDPYTLFHTELWSRTHPQAWIIYPVYERFGLNPG